MTDNEKLYRLQDSSGRYLSDDEVNDIRSPNVYGNYLNGFGECNPYFLIKTDHTDTGGTLTMTNKIINHENIEENFRNAHAPRPEYNHLIQCGYDKCERKWRYRLSVAALFVFGGGAMVAYYFLTRL